MFQENPFFFISFLKSSILLFSPWNDSWFLHFPAAVPAALFIPLVRVLSLLTQLRVGSRAGPEFNPATWHRHFGGTCRFHKHINVILNLELLSTLVRRHTINSIHFKRPTFLVSDPLYFFLVAFLQPRFVARSAKQQRFQTQTCFWFKNNTIKSQEDMGHEQMF